MNKIINHFKNEIQNGGELKEIFKDLIIDLESKENSLSNEFRHLSFRYNKFQKERIKGTIENSIELHQIISSTLDLLDDLDKQLKEENKSKQPVNIPSYYKSANIIEEIEEIEELKNNQKYDYWTLYLLGFKYLKRRLNDRAIELFNLSIKFNSKNPWAYSKLGRAYLQIDDPKNALINFDLALMHNATDKDWIYAQKGYIFKSMGQFEPAIIWFEKALEIYPEYVWAISHLGASYLGNNNFIKSKYYFEKALKLYSKDADWILKNLKICYTGLKDEEGLDTVNKILNSRKEGY